MAITKDFSKMGYHKRFLKNGLTKSHFEHKLKLITFISQKQTIKLAAVLFLGDERNVVSKKKKPIDTISQNHIV